MTSPTSIKAGHSVLNSSELLAKIIPKYDMPHPKSCEFWQRGLNDTYKLSSGTEDFVLRVYRNNWRTPSAITFELEVLMYSHQKNARIAIPVARKDGGFITPILAPEGERYVIVTQYAKGKTLKFEDVKDAITFDQAAADIHRCSFGFKSSHGRHTLDLKHLIDEPLESIQLYLGFAEKLNKNLSCYPVAQP